MRKIHTETQGNRTAKVYWNSAWQEFQVKLYMDGAIYPPAEYFTDCKADAIGTACAMVIPLDIRA